MLELKNVSKNYSNKAALSNINITLHSSEFIGLIGSNGAGKSTFMKVILGLIPNYEGEVFWRGQLMTNKNRIELLNETKAIIETPSFFPHLSGEGNLSYFAKLDGINNKEKIHEALKFVQLFDARGKKFRNYSLGMKQKLAIARVLITDASLLILDEPFNGLDPVAKEEIKELLQDLSSQGKTLLVSSHLLEELEELSDRIIVLENGSIIKDINWNVQSISTFEISIKENQKIFIENKLGDITRYNITLEPDKIIVDIERSALPEFLKILVDRKIEFYEVNNVSRQLKQFFIKKGEIA
ncbi:ABC transporter ATP-binding protein [Lysinibacillus agricola]|uniref:ABC transporter ATP-binding protein n=1 Tax=Lysinibacillus agricola TaxID=2590012 RepID=A0ABX7AQY0_9BACI|nr:MULTISPECIES: ABC transporter ATP-binding protein [Lysinibacillus]QQP12205.1 ABC transporter ATP-binding protein [Lysinibacillus agricola]